MNRARAGTALLAVGVTAMVGGWVWPFPEPQPDALVGGPNPFALPALFLGFLASIVGTVLLVAALIEARDR